MATKKRAIEWERHGDKKNSPMFEEMLPKIFERREKSGVEDLLSNMQAVVVQVCTGDAISYLAELYLMTPYRFSKGYRTKTHKVYVLFSRPEYPVFFLLEPIDEHYTDNVTFLNAIYPRAKERINAKYIGEIYRTKNVKETQSVLTSQQFRFLDRVTIGNAFLSHASFAFTYMSYYTTNMVGYTEANLHDSDSLQLGEAFSLTTEEQDRLNKSDAVQKEYGLLPLLYGIDHLATRVLSGEREDAILELLSLTNYYFWGAYNIDDMNSSTNICRSPNVTAESEMESPAKVFTANNNPYYTNSIVNLPSPTEDFVRNFGKRMHHVAYAVQDGAQPDGTKNIDYVVNKLISSDIKFLEHIIGECTDFPDLKQIFSKTSKYSVLITEYVQRCHGFQGFFTKSNVAYLTKAAGADEALPPPEPHSPTHD